jgi:hypothetical protein
MRFASRHRKPAACLFATIRHIAGHKRIYKTVNGRRASACQAFRNACTKT